MAPHYNAFISYRHRPLDIKIASEVQRQLEHMHVPKSLRSSTGTKKINRIFRDREELPITSNINDDISAAITNSDYLIVICSPDTKESIWVQREIKLFLQTHERSRVLTVLAAGEPGEVIPDILLSETLTDPNTGNVKTVRYEPLSCDYRMPLRRARREEIPRLAAALLGCSYDELRQRQRQYKNRQIMTALSAGFVIAAIIAGFFIRASIIIQDSYKQALISQSNYLANAALNSLDEGDRLTAILLASEAVPSSSNERPWTPQAEYALSQAVNAYDSSIQGNLVAAAAFDSPSEIERFILSLSGNHLCIMDVYGAVTIWDTGTRQITGHIPASKNGADVTIKALSGEQLLIADIGHLRSYAFSSGALLWDAVPCAEKAALKCDVSSDGELIAAWNADEPIISVVDSSTGSIVSTYSLASGEMPDGIQLWQVSFCQSKNRLFSKTSNFYTLEKKFCSIDLSSGKMNFFPVETDYVPSMLATGSGDIYTAELNYPEDNIFGTNFVYNDDYFYTSPDTVYISRYSAERGQKLWTASFNYSNIIYDIDIFDGQNGSIYITASNVICQFDVESGKLLGSCEVPAPILYSTYSNGNLQFVLTNGMLGLYNEADSSSASLKCMISDLEMAERFALGNKPAFCVMQSGSSRVLLYEWGQSGSNWLKYSDLSSGYSSPVSASSGDLLFLSADNKSVLINCAEDRCLWEVEFNGSSWDTAGFINNGKNILLSSKYKTLIFDVETGSSRLLPLDSSSHSNPVVLSDSLLYTSMYSPGPALIRYYCDSSSYDTIPLPDADYKRADYNSDSLFSNGILSLAAAKDKSVLVDLNTGNCRSINFIPEYVYWSSDSSFLAAAGSELAYFSSSGEHLWTVSADTDILAICILTEPECILAAGSDGRLYRYDYNGAPLGRSDVKGYISQRGVREFFCDGNGRLVFNYNGIANIIDLESLTTAGIVNNFIHYDIQAKRFIVNSDDGIGRFDICTTDGLLALGRDILGDVVLSAEQRFEYGLD